MRYDSPVAIKELVDELAERVALYNESQTCAKCGERIEELDDAFIVRRVSGKSVLIHWTAICFSEQIQEMLDEYVRQPRLRWITRAPAYEAQTLKANAIQPSTDGGLCNG